MPSKVIDIGCTNALRHSRNLGSLAAGEFQPNNRFETTEGPLMKYRLGQCCARGRTFPSPASENPTLGKSTKFPLTRQSTYFCNPRGERAEVTATITTPRPMESKHSILINIGPIYLSRATTERPTANGSRDVPRRAAPPLHRFYYLCVSR